MAIGAEEGSHLSEVIEDRAAILPARAVMNVDLKEQTANVLRTLTPREEKIVKMRFGLEGGFGVNTALDQLGSAADDRE